MSRTQSGGSTSVGNNWDAGRSGFRNPVGALLKCEHKVPAVFETCRKERNFGRRFYGCEFWKVNKGCGFFVWEDELEKYLIGRNNMLEEDVSLLREQLENEQKKRKEVEAEVLALEEEINKFKKGKFSWTKVVLSTVVVVVVMLSWS